MPLWPAGYLRRKPSPFVGRLGRNFATTLFGLDVFLSKHPHLAPVYEPDAIIRGANANARF